MNKFCGVHQMQPLHRHPSCSCFMRSFTVFFVISAPGALKSELKKSHFFLLFCINFSSNFRLSFYFFIICNHIKREGALIRGGVLITQNTVLKIVDPSNPRSVPPSVPPFVRPPVDQAGSPSQMRCIFDTWS